MKIDPTAAHSARTGNYRLGGKDNYEADPIVGDQVREVHPAIADAARHSRFFHGRAVRLLVREKGLRQFLGIGTGLPTANNTHEVAQSIAPDCRIVYVDNDPLVLAHARALLTSTPESRARTSTATPATRRRSSPPPPARWTSRAPSG